MGNLDSVAVGIGDGAGGLEASASCSGEDVAQVVPAAIAPMSVKRDHVAAVVSTPGGSSGSVASDALPPLNTPAGSSKQRSSQQRRRGHSAGAQQNSATQLRVSRSANAIVELARSTQSGEDDAGRSGDEPGLGRRTKSDRVANKPGIARAESSSKITSLLNPKALFSSWSRRRFGLAW